MDTLLGIDVGTSSCKTILIDAQGSVIDSARHTYEVRSPRYGWAEQDPEDWFEAFRRGLEEIRARQPEALSRIRAIGVTGQMIGMAVLDRQGRVIRPAIIWIDQRCLPQVEYLKKNFGPLIQRVALNPINMAYTLPKLLWLKENEPESWRRMYKIQLPKDYVRLRLTGEWVIDYNDVAGTLLLDVARLAWAEEIIEAVGLERDRLPALMASSAVAGRLTAEAANELGLPAGIPVVAGAGDLAAENLAAGITSSSQMLTRMGTAGSSSTCTERPLPDPRLIAPCYPHCIPDRWIAEIADHTFGTCERWFRDRFFEADRASAEREGRDFYTAMDEMAAEVPPGCDGLLFHPYNHGGPYWNPHLRGAFYGIAYQHDRRHFFRALLEGSTYCLKDSILLLQERIGRKPEEYRLVGGGTRSVLWTQIICDILGMDAQILKTADAALGAAMLAGLGVGLFADTGQAIRACVYRQREVIHNPERSAKYEAFYRLYSRVHDQLMENSLLIQQVLDQT
jgi:xylulokinase